LKYFRIGSTARYSVLKRAIDSYGILKSLPCFNKQYSFMNSIKDLTV